MNKDNRVKLIIISLGVLLRLVLSILNDEFNDNHVEPILTWMKYGGYPGATACWECFQPPFYYWIIKLISSVLGLSEFSEVLNVMRVIGFLASVVILYLIVNYVNRQELPKGFKYSLMLFWALNPELISIGALNTNDVLVILLGLVLYPVLCRYSQKPTGKSELAILGLIFIMGITKGNGLVYLFCFGVIWLVPAIQKFNLKQWLMMSLKVMTTLFLIGYVGQYYAKYENNGDPFFINKPKEPFPNFYQPDDEYDGRKGVTSIVQTYGTFRLISLLEEPYNRNSKENYPLHRTSMLTQLYGQFSNYFFESHPHSWYSKNNTMRNFVRVNYLLHLPLLLLMVFSFFKAWKNTLLHGIDRQGVAVIVLTLFLLFLFHYSITYRDFSHMKLIFIYPAYLALISLSFSWWEYSIVKKWVSALLLICCGLYLINYGYLVHKLMM